MTEDRTYDWRTFPTPARTFHIPFKKIDANAKAPTRNLETDAGIDLYALEDIVVPSLLKGMWCELINVNNNKCGDEICYDNIEATKVKTGIALQIPEGMYGKIEDRSSMGSKLLKTLGGVIDCEYRGDVTICFANLSFKDYYIKAGDKVAQIIIQRYEALQPVEADELTATNREAKGFGSSGT